MEKAKQIGLSLEYSKRFDVVPPSVGEYCTQKSRARASWCRLEVPKKLYKLKVQPI
jgi:hypothetical protein